MTADLDHYISSEQAFGGFLASFAYQVTEIISVNSQEYHLLYLEKKSTGMKLIVLFFEIQTAKLIKMHFC